MTFNPKGIPCVLCGVPDCEHFDIPDDGKVLSRAFRQMVGMGWQPFVYSPYIPLMVTSTHGRQEGPRTRRVSDSSQVSEWTFHYKGWTPVRKVQNYGAGFLSKFKLDTKGVGPLRSASRDAGTEVHLVSEVRGGGEGAGSDDGEERGR